MKHRSDIKFCRCRQCRRRSAYRKWVVNYTRRRFRRQTKELCRQAIDDPDVYIPDTISAGYTD